MKALVTGATGFLGAHVVRALLEHGFQVRALVRPHADLRNLHQLPVEVVQGDVTDFSSVRRAVEGCAVVFHVAALYSFWPRPRHLIYQVNVDGTRHVLQAAWEARVERVVYTSSVAALGLKTDGTPADETTPVDYQHILGDYKRSKYLAQQVALAYAQKGLPVVVVNPTFPVGPLDIKPTPTGQVIVDFLNRRMPAYLDTGLNVVSAADVGLGHVRALEKGRPGELYILGGENLTFRELLGLLSEISGLPAPRLRLPYTPVLALSYLNAGFCRLTGTTPRMTPETVRMARHRMFFSPAKAVRELGFPQTPAREALAQAVAWFRAQGMVRGA